MCCKVLNWLTDVMYTHGRHNIITMMATRDVEEKMERGDIEMPSVEPIKVLQSSSMMNDGLVHTLEWHVESYAVGKGKRVLQNIGR